MERRRGTRSLICGCPCNCDGERIRDRRGGVFPKLATGAFGPREGPRMRRDPRARKPVGACRSSFRISGIRGADLRLSDEPEAVGSRSTVRGRAMRPRPPARRPSGLKVPKEALRQSFRRATNGGLSCPDTTCRAQALWPYSSPRRLAPIAADAAPTTLDDLIVTRHPRHRRRPGRQDRLVRHRRHGPGLPGPPRSASSRTSCATCQVLR